MRRPSVATILPERDNRPNDRFSSLVVTTTDLTQTGVIPTSAKDKNQSEDAKRPSAIRQTSPTFTTSPQNLTQQQRISRYSNAKESNG